MINEIKSSKDTSINEYKNENNEMPKNERQTVDIDEYDDKNLLINEKTKEKPKSRYGSW